MNKYICLDSSVWIKFLTWEEGSKKARLLLEQILARRQTVVAPDFCWAEIASVLRKKFRANLITIEEMEIIWDSFCHLKILKYIHNNNIIKTAWQIAQEESLPTVYDAAYLAAAKLHSAKKEICEFWTSDHQLISTITKNAKYIRELR